MSERESQYGPPGVSLRRTAAAWSALLGVEITPSDVCLMMIVLKASRLMHDSGQSDSWVDIAGYAAIGGEVSGGAAAANEQS
jgi:Domain of unknown function (DUF6378)